MFEKCVKTCLFLPSEGTISRLFPTVSVAFWTLLKKRRCAEMLILKNAG